MTNRKRRNVVNMLVKKKSTIEDAQLVKCARAHKRATLLSTSAVQLYDVKIDSVTAVRSTPTNL